MTTTFESLSDTQIDSLRDCAGQAGDGMLVAICDRAQNREIDLELLTPAQVRRLSNMTIGDAQQACVDAINDAVGRKD